MFTNLTVLCLERYISWPSIFIFKHTWQFNPHLIPALVLLWQTLDFLVRGFDVRVNVKVIVCAKIVTAVVVRFHYDHNGDSDYKFTNTKIQFKNELIIPYISRKNLKKNKLNHLLQIDFEP